MSAITAALDELVAERTRIDAAIVALTALTGGITLPSVPRSPKPEARSPKPEARSPIVSRSSGGDDNDAALISRMVADQAPAATAPLRTDAHGTPATADAIRHALLRGKTPKECEELLGCTYQIAYYHRAKLVTEGKLQPLSQGKGKQESED